MTVIPRIVAAIAVLASVVPYVAATSSQSCKSTEFFYETKSCCVPKTAPSSPPAPPSGKSCPSSNSANWYWSNDKDCCLPTSAPPAGNPAPTCKSGHSWNEGSSCCEAPQPPASTPSGPSSCQSSEFWFDSKKCCLPHGGVPNPPSPPSGSECPPSGWYWGKSQGCCVPHHPLPPSPPPPQCPSGWEWVGGVFQCQPIPPSHPQPPPSKPSGVHYKKRANTHRASNLCPRNLTACPISNANGLTADYECLDTKEELTSCGGCSSAGTGQDCTAIRGSWNVGCQAGTCAVFSCMSGFKLSLDRNSCIQL
ncbi:hypothetical protein FA95DRAFT_1534038 [Auriscalpium vulgare]|uniref:Uncharacterized protein n=1 Tax=Auriscalpium vulgare TaxID=40419 RepID=A0ACB8S708_9AGAM|nr:hypothetical protein FA95DRAFT_1534038 [Auriscalpium vulgare]